MKRDVMMNRSETVDERRERRPERRDTRVVLNCDTRRIESKRRETIAKKPQLRNESREREERDLTAETKDER